MTLCITVYRNGDQYYASGANKSITGNRTKVIIETEKWIKEYLDSHPIEESSK